VQFQQFTRGLVTEGHMVVPKVPIASLEGGNVWTEHNKATVWLQMFVNMAYRLIQCLFVREMLEEVASEDQIQ
jgi:hypothetical protein